MKPKGHHERGYLPHRDYGGALQAVTFRETDSLPKKLVLRWRAELKNPLLAKDTEEQAQQELLRKIARYEDAGHGRCVLRSEAAAAIVQDQLLADHESSCRLIAWCVMPNHVHVMIRQRDDQSLGEIVGRWKGRSARAINQQLKRSGPCGLGTTSIAPSATPTISGGPSATSIAIRLRRAW